MKYIVMLMALLTLSSCVIKRGFHGCQIKSYTIDSAAHVRFITESNNPYAIDLVNNSKGDVTFIVKTVGGSSFILKKSEVLKISEEIINGLQIANEAKEEGILTLSVYLENEEFSLPSVERIP